VAEPVGVRGEDDRLIDLSLEVPNLPVLPFADWLRLGEVAFAMVMILYAESYGSISAFALKHGDRVNSNRDCWRWGPRTCCPACSMACRRGRVFGDIGQRGGGCHVTAGRWRGGAGGAGDRLTVLPYIALTPEPILAAIVIHALARGLSLQPLGRYFIWRRDRVLVMCAVGAVLVLGVLDGLLVSGDQRAADAQANVGGGYPGARADRRRARLCRRAASSRGGNRAGRPDRATG
jgi:hypothetical protein